MLSLTYCVNSTVSRYYTVFGSKGTKVSSRHSETNTLIICWFKIVIDRVLTVSVIMCDLILRLYKIQYHCYINILEIFCDMTKAPVY